MYTSGSECEEMFWGFHTCSAAAHADSNDERSPQEKKNLTPPLGEMLEHSAKTFPLSYQVRYLNKVNVDDPR